jgi:hypothetical protein
MLFQLRVSVELPRMRLTCDGECMGMHPLSLQRFVSSGRGD